MSGVTATEPTINFTFGWKGPNSSEKNDLVTNRIRLEFPNTVSKLSVRIPDSKTTHVNLPITKQNPDNSKLVTDTFKITIEKMRGLKVMACIDERGSGAIERSTKEVPLQLPVAFEADQTYHLAFTSNNFSFTAALTKLDVFAYAKAQDELYSILDNLLTPLMTRSMLEFIFACAGDPKPRADGNANNVGPYTIKSEIQLLDPTALCASMEKIPAYQASGDQSAVDSECFQLMGEERIKNIFRKNLFGLMEKEVCQGNMDVINDIAESYTNRIFNGN